MGRHATVLSIRGGEIDPTGLPEPLGLLLDPKTGNFFFFAPLLGVSPSGQFTLVQWKAKYGNTVWCSVVVKFLALWLGGGTPVGSELAGPPARRPPPAGLPTSCLCATQKVSLCNTEIVPV